MQRTFNNDLFQQLLTPENLHRAWRQVKANKGAAGIDGMTLDDFPLWMKQGGWQQCKTQLIQGEYQPSAVRRVEIDKLDGGKRKLGIPTIIDRVIQQAIAQILTPLFDPHFSASSFGFRPKRNAKQAVLQVRDIIKQKRKIAVDVDLSKFFDRVNHDLLMTQLKQTVQDKRLLALIGKYLRAGERVLKSITHYLATTLKLVVNEQKSQVVKVSQSKFLGFTFNRGNIQWHAKTLHLFKQKIRRLTNRNWGVSMGYQLYKVTQYIRGWINYFGIANVYQKCVDLDHWIRRRIRMCYWRQWRKPRTKIANLLKRGVGLDLAVTCGATNKGVWRSSKTPGIQQALNNDYLKQAGLYSLREGWIAAHYPNQKA